MKKEFLNKFETQQEYSSYTDGQSFITPDVSYILDTDRVKYTPKDKRLIGVFEVEDASVETRIKTDYNSNIIVDEIDGQKVTVEEGEDGYYYPLSYGVHTIKYILPEIGEASYISEYAFYDCEKLVGVKIPENVEIIDTSAFYNTTIKKLIIPKSVQELWGYSLNYGQQKNTVYPIIFKSEIPPILQGEDGDRYPVFDTYFNIIYVPQNALPRYKREWSRYSGIIYPIPEYDIEFTRITYKATSQITPGSFGCNMVKHTFEKPYGASIGTGIIVLDKKITHLPTEAFRGKLIREVELPDSLTSIGDQAFYSCTQLTKITIPDKVTEMGSQVFESCTNLLEVSLPDSLTYIPYQTFQYCSNLKNISFSDNVKRIEDYAFYNCSNLKTLSIPEGVEYLGSQSFANCIRLISISLPSKIKEIRYRTFYNCQQLKAIEIPEGVKRINSEAFSNCINLETIKLPKSIKNIDGWSYISSSNAFYNCNKLVKAGQGQSNIQFEWEDKIPGYVLGAFKYMTSVDLPNGLKEIERNAFYGCNALTSIKIPKGVRKIGASAFTSCANLSSVIIPKSVKNFEVSHNPWNYCDFFNSCPLLTTAGPIGGNYNIQFGWDISIPDNVFANSNLTNITLPDTITHIGKNSFRGSKLTTVTLPQSVIEIGGGAFDWCAQLLSVITSGSNLRKIGSRAFSDCSALNNFNLDIQENLKSIGHNAFSNCYNLNLQLPLSNITFIGRGAFSRTNINSFTTPAKTYTINGDTLSNCNNLRSVDLSNVKKVGSYAFAYSYNLDPVDFPYTVTQLGHRIFEGVTRLSSIKFYGQTPPKIEEDTFDSYSGATFTIYVPNEYLDEYKQAENWTNYESRIVGY